MLTQFGLRNSRILLPILAAVALLGISSCGDSSDKNECTEITCEPPTAFCDDNVAVSYVDGGTCIESTGVCDLTDVERRNDCSERVDSQGNAEVCVEGACQPRDYCADDPCAQPEDSCIGSTSLLTYSGAGACDELDGTCDFDAVSTTIDCADDGKICKDGACETEELCGDDACSQPDDTCEDTTHLITYSGAGVCDETNGDCDYEAVATTVDCAEDDKVCQLGACVDEAEDLCENQTCDQPDDTCDGNTVLSYSGAGTCDPANGDCDFSGVETRTDCGTDEICQDGACVEETTDPCEGVTCDDAPAPSCDGDTAVTYTGDDGVCVDSDGSCDYSAQKVETDCTADGKTCNTGICVDAGDDHSVNPGDLVITELSANPDFVTDDNGEYFEVYNTTGRTLHLNDLVVSDDGGASFDVAQTPDAPIELASNAYFVFAANADTSTNGGIDVDFEWSSFGLTNGDDEIIITVPGTTDVEIARIAYGSGTDFPSVTAGKSMQFGLQSDFADTSDGTLWCDSTDPIDATNTDLGTPGAENTNCP